MDPFTFAKHAFRSLRWKHVEKNTLALLREHFDMDVYDHGRRRRAESANPLNAHGLKCFSQSDEDGITLEILRRMDALDDGTFVEFGVGDGMENNTLILSSLGWKGVWAGGEKLAPRIDVEGAKRLAYLKSWITRGNVVDLLERGLTAIGRAAPDVISLDLDGNDLHLVDALLAAGFAPKLFIVEYNAKFPPPVRWSVSYDEHHVWKSDDYFGASLASFVEVFERFGYRLVCCNAQTGANAFFVDRRHDAAFADVPTDIRSLYQGPRYWLYRNYGHARSVKTVETVINGRPAAR